MLTPSVNADQFTSLIQDNELVFIDFWAEWCAPCKQFAKVYEQVATENPAITFAKINIEEEAEIAEAFEIRSIPHLMVFKQGIIIYSDAGSMPESMFKDLVKQAVEADVSEIRAQIDNGEKLD